MAGAFSRSVRLTLGLAILFSTGYSPRQPSFGISLAEAQGSGPIAFDARECERRTYHRYLGEGSQRVEVIGREGADCVFNETSEIEGGFDRRRCRVAASAGTVTIPNDGNVPGEAPGRCVHLERGDHFSATPEILLSAASGNVEEVKTLISVGQDVNGTSQLRDAVLRQLDQTQGMTPLMAAAKGGHRDVVGLLLQAGADVSRQCTWWFDRRSETYLLTGWTAACFAATEGHSEVLKLLPRRASDAACLAGAFLLNAVRQGDVREVERRVREVSLGEKRVALEMAVSNANVAAVQALIAADALDRTDSELLRSVLRSRNRDLAIVLIEAGIDCKTADEYGVTALGIAAENGDAVAIRSLLAAGADPNQTCGHELSSTPPGTTALMIAAARGQVEAVKALIAGGARINAADVHGRTALMEAVRHERMDAACLLVGAGATLNQLSESEMKAVLSTSNRDECRPH